MGRKKQSLFSLTINQHAMFQDQQISSTNRPIEIMDIFIMHYSCCKYFKILLLLRGRVIDLAIRSLFNASVTQEHKKHKYSTSQVCFYKNLTVFHCKPFRDLQGKPIGYSEKRFMGSPNCQRHQDTLPQIKKPHQQNVDHLCRGGGKQQTRIFCCEQKARPWHRFSPKTHSCFP